MDNKFINTCKSVSCLVILLLFIGVIGCKSQKRPTTLSKKNSEPIKMDTSLIPPKAFNKNAILTEIHPLSKNIESFLDTQDDFPDFEPSGINRSVYLTLIEAQVRAMLKYQDDDGRIIDPVEKAEKYYTTPCFSHAVSALVVSSTITSDSDLAKRGMKALDVSLTDMVNASVNGNHGDFYTWPVMLAYNSYKPFASDSQLKSWDKKLQSLDIEKLYAFYNQERNLNWILVHASGEFLRAKEGFTSFEYPERMIKYQLGNFTDLGMYDEHGNPFAYDIFARHYLNGMLQLDYRGAHYLTLRDNLWKGAWTSLFIQSPSGELPTGYRSSHHIWNEAEQCVVFEIYAGAYAKAGYKKEAGAFKRAAMLSLKSMQNWVREDGSGFIVKNRFPIEKKHAYERYSVHTCYNMLAMSMLAQAWQFSNESIKEFAAPADTGGFVIPILEPFHKVFANSSGTYVEYDTNGDQEYNPTGILRVHVKGGHPQLGPSDGIAENIGGSNNVLALGLSWQNDNGSWVSLAKSKNTTPIVRIIEENKLLVKFSITHHLKDSITNKDAELIETITIKDGVVTVLNKFTGIKGNKKLIWPILVNDGAQNVSVKVQNRSVSLSLDGKGTQLSIDSPEDVEFQRSGEQYDHRNGIAEIVYVVFKDNTLTYSLRSKD